MAHTSTRASSRRATVVVIASLVLAVVVASPLHGPLNNPNEGVRVFTVKALVEHGTLAIDDVTRAWGFIDDKARKDGHTFQSKAPLPALIAAAAYALVHPFTGDLSRPTLTRLCRVAGSGVPVAVMLGLTWWALRRRHPGGPVPNDDDGDGDGDGDDDTIVAGLMVGLLLGTGVLASLQVFSGHAIAAVAPAAIVALARHPGPPARWGPTVAGLLFGMAATSEYPAALCAPLVLLVVRQDPSHGGQLRRLGTAAMAATIAMLPTLVAHQLMWGAPWRTGYSFLDNPHYRPLVEGTFFGIGLPDLRVLATTLVSPELGLFWFSPFLVLGLFGLRRRSPVDRTIIVVTMIAFLAFIAGFRGWRGGWSVGPRYILELAGILTVLAVDGVRIVPARMRVVVVTILVGLGVLHSGLAGAFFPHLPDVLRAPVGELILPFIWRGFAPDSLPLALGLSSSTSAAIVAGCVLLPVFLFAAMGGAPRAAFAGVIVVAIVALLEVRLVPVDPRRGLEVRRVMDNWRPERGNPFTVDLATAAAATRFGLDRQREVTRPIDCTGPSRPRRRDVGPGTAAIRGVVDAARAGTLVVVDDALADHIAATGGAALVVAMADVARIGPLPCTGDITVVLRQDLSQVGRGPLPPALRNLTAVTDPTALDEGFVVQRLRRASP